MACLYKQWCSLWVYCYSVIADIMERPCFWHSWLLTPLPISIEFYSLFFPFVNFINLCVDNEFAPVSGWAWGGQRTTSEAGPHVKLCLRSRVLFWLTGVLHALGSLTCEVSSLCRSSGVTDNHHCIGLSMSCRDLNSGCQAWAAKAFTCRAIRPTGHCFTSYTTLGFCVLRLPGSNLLYHFCCYFSSQLSNPRRGQTLCLSE